MPEKGRTDESERPRRKGLAHLLLRGASGALALRLAGAGLMFGLQVFLARSLGAEHYGDYIFAFSLLTFLSILLKLGLDMATIRFLPVYQSRGEWGLIRGLLQRTLQVQMASSSAFALLLLLIIWIIRQQLELGLYQTLLAAAPLLPLLTMQLLSEARLRALHRVSSSRFPQEVLQPLAIAALVYTALTLGDGEISARSAMVYTLAATMGAVSVAFGLFRGVRPQEIREASPEYRTRHWMGTALQLSLVASGTVIINQIDVLLAGYFLGTTKAGTYAVASRIARLVPFGLTAVNLAVSPMISSLWAEKRHAELQRIVSLAAVGILLATLPVAIGFWVFGEELLGLFGAEFADAETALLVLVTGKVLGALCGSTSLLLTLTGHQLLVAKVMGTSALIDIVLHVILVPRYGILGAAAATTLTTALWNFILIVVVFRKMRLDPTVLAFFSRRNRPDRGARD